jgi:hypothetical protein
MDMFEFMDLLSLNSNCLLYLLLLIVTLLFSQRLICVVFFDYWMVFFGMFEYIVEVRRLYSLES